MDSDELALLLLVLLPIVTICVIALVVICKKRIELKDSMSDKTSADDGLSIKNPEPKSTEDGPKQVTIYEYNSSSKMCLCPLCDGENNTESTYCHVCGQQLK